MSTNAESAKQWVKEKNPSNDAILDVLTKLEKRIDEWEGDDEGIQGSIEAADYLSGLLQETKEATSAEVSLDTGALIPDQEPVSLSEEVKQQTFDALKSQLGIKVK